MIYLTLTTYTYLSIAQTAFLQRKGTEDEQEKKYTNMHWVIATVFDVAIICQIHFSCIVPIVRLYKNAASFFQLNTLLSQLKMRQDKTI